MGLDWCWLVSYLLQAFPEAFFFFFLDSPDVSSGESHVQLPVLVLVEVDQGICFFPCHLFHLFFFLCVCGGCVVFPLSSFSVSFCIYFFCFGVSGMGLYGAGPI